MTHIPTKKIIDYDAIREKAIKEDADQFLKGKFHVQERLTELIEYLTVNKDHIAGAGIVVMGYENDALVDPRDGSSENGFSQRFAASKPYHDLVSMELEKLGTDDIPSPLVAFLGRPENTD